MREQATNQFGPESISQPDSQQAPVDFSFKADKKPKIWLVAILVILLLGVFGATGYLVYQLKQPFKTARVNELDSPTIKSTPSTATTKCIDEGETFYPIEKKSCCPGLKLAWDYYVLLN